MQKQKSLWRITAFPAFLFVMAMALPLLAAADGAGAIPDWLLIFLFIIWLVGFLPALAALVWWIL